MLVAFPRWSETARTLIVTRWFEGLCWRRQRLPLDFRCFQIQRKLLSCHCLTYVVESTSPCVVRAIRFAAIAHMLIFRKASFFNFHLHNSNFIYTSKWLLFCYLQINHHHEMFSRFSLDFRWKSCDSKKFLLLLELHLTTTRQWILVKDKQNTRILTSLTSKSFNCFDRNSLLLHQLEVCFNTFSLPANTRDSLNVA